MPDLLWAITLAYLGGRADGHTTHELPSIAHGRVLFRYGSLIAYAYMTGYHASLSEQH